MKKYLALPILVLGIFVFLLTANFKLQPRNDESKSTALALPIDSLKSHDIYNDYRPNLVIPPYVYYPPSPDNPLISRDNFRAINPAINVIINKFPVYSGLYLNIHISQYMVGNFLG